jgi:hypothetical protein
LGLVVSKESAGTEHKALSGGIGGIVEERDVASQLAHTRRIVREDPRGGIVGTVGDTFASSSRIVCVVFWYEWADSNTGESRVVGIGQHIRRSIIRAIHLASSREIVRIGEL